MLLTGQLWATSDFELVNELLRENIGVKIIYLGDPESVPPQYRDIFIMGTSLTPNYETLSLLIDGDENAFIQHYTMSLNSKASIEMMTALLACLYKGTSLILFLPKDSIGMNYIQYLLKYIEYNFGIVTQTKSTKFSFNPLFTGKIAELLYLSNLMSPHEFLVNTESLNDISLRKLVTEIRPMVNNPGDMNEIIQWFSNFKDELLKAKKPLINGVQYAGEDGDYACY